MTGIIAISVALALIINGVTLICAESLLNNKFLAANLVYLISVSLLLREFNVLPAGLWRKCYVGCFFVEIIFALYILESSLTYIWRFIENYIISHSDVILERVSQNDNLHWLICHVCCGKLNCETVLTDLVLKALSFTFLMGIGLIIRR